MYLLKINNMKFRGHIGYYPEEKVIGQDLEVDIEVSVKAQGEADQLEATINYATIYEQVAQVVKASRVDLIEALIEEIIEAVGQIDPSRTNRVRVRLRKMNVPIDGVFDSVEIEMER